jgi:magnesium-protoporphyrin IX monomethyl ester (oxidative) cyclase
MSEAAVSDAAVNLTTQQALDARPLAPRFYCTDYAAMEHIDIEPVRAEWDLMMRDFELDKNRGHFKQNYEYDPSILESDPELKEEFLDLLVSSITAEYSGCVLYQEIEKNVSNPDISKLMRYMARDESRHAGFINKALNKLGVAVDLGVLKREKEYTFFKPEIYLLCDVSFRKDRLRALHHDLSTPRAPSREALSSDF